ncbi:MAG TPA: adenylate kinase [Dehalococcoidia bacterium]|nr:adenylate kinase [Dehalococcoidia bacterium]
MFIVLLGLPGAGKGTQAAFLKDDLGLPHVTTGDLFRENISKETDLGKQAKEYVESGKLVPNDITIGMLLDRIAQPDCAGGCMIDGFPRNLEQAKALDKALEERGRAINRALYIKVSEDELVRRLSGRWTCPKCAAVYHETSAPPKAARICDNCGSELSQRADDKPDVVRTRLQVNMENMQAIIDYYAAQSNLCKVNGEQDAAAVTTALKGCLED